MPRTRSLALPELFLGLATLAVAAIVSVHIAANTFKDIRHVRDTVSVTGSARKPITADLVRWSLTVSSIAPTAPPAAKRLRAESEAVRAFLRAAGIPADAISPAVVTNEVIVERISKKKTRTRIRVAQRLDVGTRQIDVVERVATRLGELIERGIDVSAEPLAYISTELTQAKLDALESATADARHRAEILVRGLGGKLGPMRSSSLGVYQVTPRDSTDVSDYGINDTSTRDKDVTAVVTATFAAKR